MNRSNTAHVTFPFDCRQRLWSEPVFKSNSRIAQEWTCDYLSRMEGGGLLYAQNSSLQQSLATDRAIRDS